MPDPPALSDVADLLRQPLRIAVLGAHSEPARPAHYVPAYLRDRGWEIVPVNPRQVGQKIFGRPVVATLQEAGSVELVCVFRRGSALPAHLDELLAAGAPTVWFQQGIRHDEVAQALRAAGMRVVQDRCMLADHRRLGA